MKAMIFAAGLGRRLKPFTENTPKALVHIAGKPLLEWTIIRLKNAGVTEIIINTFHLAEQIHDFIRNANFPGVNIRISYEHQLLDTGGGLKNARHFFDDKSFIVHNVDVFSSIDFGEMMRFHQQNKPLATLAVQKRPTRRYLIVDSQDQLCGRQPGNDDFSKLTKQGIPPYRPVGFSGVHIIDPKIFSLIKETGAFPIFDLYLRLIASGHSISCFDVGDSFWIDVGTPERLEKLQKYLKQ